MRVSQRRRTDPVNWKAQDGVPTCAELSSILRLRKRVQPQSAFFQAPKMHTGRPPHCIKARCSAFFQVPKNARTKAPVRSSRPQKPHTGFPTAHKCVLPGPQNAHRSPTLHKGHVPASTAAASCPSRSRSAARAACSGSLAMMHQANASRLQLRAKRCNLIMPFRTYGLRTHDFSTYESYVRTSVPMQLRS